MFLGIEIGGTKLQLAIGSGADRKLHELVCLDVVPQDGAEGIRRQIGGVGKQLLGNYPVKAVGIGFGGPVDIKAGRTLHSFQIAGWDDFSLASWCQQKLGLPTWIENDSNLAGLGEARLGAGQGQSVVFYTNIGSGIGGALIIDGEIFHGGLGSAVAEIGHMRPGLANTNAVQTVESIASGWGIAAAGKAILKDDSNPDNLEKRKLLDLCEGDPNQLTGKQLAQALIAGNRLAEEIFERVVQTYGWAIGQVVTLLAPNVVVVGGGIAQIGETLFLSPLRRHVDCYAIKPLREQLTLVAAELGEEVVLHGALTLARSSFLEGS
jgi:glucokinase